jgi:hypothetical protein
VFNNAYSAMLKKIKLNYPEAEIWCVTLCRDDVNGGNSVDICTDGFSQIISDCAEKCGCKLIDLNKYAPYDTYDLSKLHPSAQGMRDISSAVLKEIAKF